jgi:formate-dependent nitrite reductase membrane component NrfD
MSRVMIKVNGRFIVKETLFWLVLFGIIYYTSTYDGKTFKEGFIEMTTDPSFYYIIIGLVGVGVIVYYVDKMMKKNKEEE